MWESLSARSILSSTNSLYVIGKMVFYRSKYSHIPVIPRLIFSNNINEPGSLKYLSDVTIFWKFIWNINWQNMSMFKHIIFTSVDVSHLSHKNYSNKQIAGDLMNSSPSYPRTWKPRIHLLRNILCHILSILDSKV